MTPKKAILSALLLAAAASSEARGCGSGSCGTLAPRRYQYSRTRDPFSLVSDIFSMPLYSNSLMRQLDAEKSRLSRSTMIHYDVSEDPKSGVVELSVELPGVTAKDVVLELENENQLRITGVRRLKHHGTYYQSEFDQVFQLNPDVDPDRLQASLSAGILTVRVPKRERLVKRIPIAVADEEEPVQMVAEKSEEEPAETHDTSVDPNGLEVTEEEN